MSTQTAEATAVTQTAPPPVVVDALPGVYEIYWRDNPGQVMEVDIDEVHVKPEDDVRVTTASVDDKSPEWKQFVAMINEHGATPIEVVIQDGKLYVDDGRRRLAAQKVLGKAVVRVIPAKDNGVGLTRTDALTRAMALNTFKGLNPIDKLTSIKKIMEAAEADGTKLTKTEIAKRVGMSPGGLTGYLSLEKYDAEAQELIATGKAPYAASIAIMSDSKSPEEASKTLKELAAAGGGIKYGQARAAVAKKKGKSAGGSGVELSSSAAIKAIDKYTKALLDGETDKAQKAKLRTGPEVKVSNAIKDYLKMGLDFEKVLERIFKAWD